MSPPIYESIAGWEGLSDLNTDKMNSLLRSGVMATRWSREPRYKGINNFLSYIKPFLAYFRHRVGILLINLPRKRNYLPNPQTNRIQNECRQTKWLLIE